MDSQKRTRLVSLCAGCGHQILDRYILRVSPDLEWHATCLKCVACQRNLDQSSTCFIKDGKTLCKDDYRRLYAIKCAKCHKPFTSLDHVMRAQFHVYHAHCFRCEGCDRQLLTGDEFTFREGSLFCTASHELSGLLMASSGHALHRTPPEKSAKEAGKHTTRQSRPARTTRVRTVLSESQLHTLQACYSANPRPDALVKEQLVEMTGLSPRVIRVWFQNKRCKDKKRSAVVVEELFPALSPESPGVDVLMSSLDFHSFSPCWKMLSSFSVYSDADCMQDQHLASAAHVQNFGWEDAPVPSELPDTPCILTSNPVQGNK
ncbi:islet1, like [Electrophorus electricus]|uniref:islet1, like n=1 Tax=Electrophorus electricus TaxID=8005 RepID=UPI0015CFD8D4|nr:islet1, like [Electrophorus electricus]